MGQQQLLIIALAVIIVAAAIVMGINIYNAHSIQTNRDAMLNNLQHVATLTQQYYKKPRMLGGGGGNYTGVDNSGVIPTGLVANDNGNIAFTVSPNSVILTGQGVEEVNSAPIEYTILVTATSIGDPVLVN